VNTKKVIITQSNYIPWKGYFDSFQLVDEVILYDDMQYTKRDWRNRNQIKTPQGLKWLSIPVEVKGKYFQAIKDTKISEKKWKDKHWKTLQGNYAKAPFFKEYQEIFKDLYLNCEEEYLSLINYRFLEGINKILGIPNDENNLASLIIGEQVELEKGYYELSFSFDVTENKEISVEQFVNLKISNEYRSRIINKKLEISGMTKKITILFSLLTTEKISFEFVNKHIIKHINYIKLEKKLKLQKNPKGFLENIEIVKNYIDYDFHFQENENSYLINDGWCFFSNKENTNNIVKIVLKDKEHNIYLVDTEPSFRPDVTAFFKKNYNLDNSGFSFKLPKKQIKKGKYSIGIYIQQGEKKYLKWLEDLDLTNSIEDIHFHSNY